MRMPVRRRQGGRLGVGCPQVVITISDRLAAWALAGADRWLWLRRGARDEPAPNVLLAMWEVMDTRDFRRWRESLPK